MSDSKRTIKENGAGMYIYQNGELIPVHTQNEQHMTELKAYLHEWDLPGIKVEYHD